MLAMRMPAGQAVGHGARHCGRTLHRLLHWALILAGLVAITLGALAYRLSQGPLQVTWIAQRLERALVPSDSPARLTIGSAAIAWEGFHGGVDRPLDIRLTDMRAGIPGQPTIADITQAELSLSLGWLLAGRVIPRALRIDSAILHLQRTADGAMTLDLGSMSADKPSSDTPPEPFDPQHMLDQLARPVGTDASGNTSTWAQIRRLYLTNVTISAQDSALGADWRVEDTNIDLRRRPSGGLDGTGRATLVLADHHLNLILAAAMDPVTRASKLEAKLSTFNPATLAKAAPGLATLAALDTPLTVTASARLGPELAVQTISAHAVSAAGTAHIGTGTMPIVSADVTVDTDLRAVRAAIQLKTAPVPNGPVTTIKARAQGHREDDRLTASLVLDLDRAAFADLPAIWPAGTGGPGTRPWITKNITAGIGHDLHVEVAGTAPLDFSDATVTSIAGGLDADDLTVHWLRPVPPIEHANGRLTLVTADQMDVTINSGRQSGGTKGGVIVKGGKVVLTGIAAHDQFAQIDAELAGPLVDVIAVLKHPKVGILSRRPIPMNNPAGDLTGHITFAHLPLKDNIALDDIAIHAATHLTNVHLGGIAAGRDLDQGDLAIDATNDGLKVDGNARISTIPSNLTVSMDFRDGPPSQILTRVDITGTADDRQLSTAGIDPGKFLLGTVELKASVLQRRNGAGDVTAHADLQRTRMDAAMLNWAKAAGTPAVADAHVLLDHDRVSSIEHISIQGEGVDVRGQADMANGRPNVLRLDRVMVGRDTDAAGTIKLPAAAGDPYVVALAGRGIDLTGVFASRSKTARSEPARPDAATGPPWQANLRFERVVLAEGRALMDISASAEDDGGILRRVEISGRTSPKDPFKLSVTPAPHGRRLVASAADTGSLLRALDVIKDLREGQLNVTGAWDDTDPSHPLTGQADLSSFRVTGTPILAKILQAMTLYGLVEAVQGPGLGFTHAAVPFQYADDTITLNNARAYSASLGMTAKGSVDLGHDRADLDGTIVPAYFFNSLLGRIPLIGRVFSPERGGGVFAATFTVRGPFADPSVNVNPLAALTPGFLRGLFDGEARVAPERQRNN